MVKDTTLVITATELKKNLGKYMDYTCQDNEVVITKNGSKAIRMTPYINNIERYFTVKEVSPDYVYGGKKVSYEEFMEIYSKSDLRMEYINGEIIIQASPSPQHQEISGNLNECLRNFLKGKSCKVFYSPFDVHFYKRGFKTPDVMQPDLLVICDFDKFNENGRYLGTPIFVVEILSRSTRSRDMVDKLNTYMLSSVKEFWVVDPDAKTVMLYSFNDCKVEQFVIYREGETIHSYFFEGLTVNVSDIFENVTVFNKKVKY